MLFIIMFINKIKKLNTSPLQLSKKESIVKGKIQNNEV